MQAHNLVKGASQGTLGTMPASTALYMLSTKWALAAESDFNNATDVLNYALTLEYLEAAFYKQGTDQVSLSNSDESKYLESIQTDEEAHVEALTKTIKKLGETPVQAPKVDFGDAFSSRKNFLSTAFTFENLGVSAYLGAAPALFDQKDLLVAAASIYGVEARHAAIIGNLLGKPAKGGVYMGATETPKSRQEVLDAAAPFLASQMGNMPNGGVDTGRGGTSGTENPALFGVGAAALAGAGVAAYAATRGTKEDEGEA